MYLFCLINNTNDLRELLKDGDKMLDDIFEFSKNENFLESYSETVTYKLEPHPNSLQHQQYQEFSHQYAYLIFFLYIRNALDYPKTYNNLNTKFGSILY